MLIHKTFVLRIAGGCHSIGVVCDGDFGVYYHRPSLREAHYYIGTKIFALLVLNVLLHKVFPIFCQAAALQNALQHHLAPVALRLVLSLERLGKVGGICAYSAGLLPEALYGVLLLLLEEFECLLKGACYLIFVQRILFAVLLHALAECLKLLF